MRNTPKSVVDTAVALVFLLRSSIEVSSRAHFCSFVCVRIFLIFQFRSLRHFPNGHHQLRTVDEEILEAYNTLSGAAFRRRAASIAEELGVPPEEIGRAHV